MSNVFYEGSDGYVHSLEDGDSIKHWKYIKKIKNGKGYRYFYSQDEIDAYYKDKVEKDKIEYDKIEKDKIEKDKKYKYDYSPETKKRAKRKKKIKNAINNPIDKASRSIEKGRSAVENRLNKAKKTAKNEAKGIKRASNAIKGKGNYSYDAHDTNPKSYWKYDKKKKRSIKAGKTGKIERNMIGAYRRTHPYE